MSSPFFTTASGRKDGIVFMILLSGNLDDDTYIGRRIYSADDYMKCDEPVIAKIKQAGR
jgi:hypothetical protein